MRKNGYIAFLGRYKTLFLNFSESMNYSSGRQPNARFRISMVLIFLESRVNTGSTRSTHLSIPSELDPMFRCERSCLSLLAIHLTKHSIVLSIVTLWREHTSVTTQTGPRQSLRARPQVAADESGHILATLWAAKECMGCRACWDINGKRCLKSAAEVAVAKLSALYRQPISSSMDSLTEN